MTKIERKEELLRIIRQKRRLHIAELNGILPASRATLQRDLTELEQEGMIDRKYGFVSYAESCQDLLMGKLLHPNDKITRIEDKIRIGKAAQDLIQDQDVVFITHGTTTRQIFLDLPQSKKFTVLTEGIDILCLSADYPNIRTFLVGGLSNYNTMQLEYAPYITSELDQVNVQKLIMGVAAVSLTNGITFYDYASYHLLSHIVDRVEEIIILADSTKFGRKELIDCIPIEKVNTIVTDSGLSMEYLDGFEKLGIRCILT